MARAHDDDKSPKKNAPKTTPSTESVEEYYRQIGRLDKEFNSQSSRRAEERAKAERDARSSIIEAEHKKEMLSIEEERRQKSAYYDEQIRLAEGNDEKIASLTAKRYDDERSLLERQRLLQQKMFEYESGVQSESLKKEKKIHQTKIETSKYSKSVFDRERIYRQDAIDCELELQELAYSISTIEDERTASLSRIATLESQIASETDASNKSRLSADLEREKIQAEMLSHEHSYATTQQSAVEERLAASREEASKTEEILKRIGGKKLQDFYAKREQETQQQLEIKTGQQEEMQAEKDWINEEISLRKEEAEKNGTVADTADLEERLAELTEAMSANGDEIIGLNSQLKYYGDGQIEAAKVKDPFKAAANKFDEIVKGNRERKIEKENKKADKEAKKAFKQMLKDNYWTGDGTSNGGQGDMQRELNENAKEELKEQLSEKLDNLKTSIAEGMANLAKTIDENISSFYAYQATVEARLQGSQESFSKLTKTMSGQLIANPYVKQTDMLQKINEAVDLGIAYNLDLRAFLATVSDKVATTFDAFEVNLLKLIRLQQADTTAARMGMEASLTKLFNQYFSDTSYLSDVAKSVREALLESTSLLNYDDALDFEYMVQKWMGSLYSVGFSDSTISKIAQGINYLGTGNVDALNSDDQLNTLMAMAASKAGLSYGEILLNGLNAKDTNLLLKSMVQYLAEIAQSTDTSNVTKSAYTNIFGMNMSDIRALQNLSSIDLSNIYNETLNYGGAMQELSNQFSQVSSRIHGSQLIDTIIENATMSASLGIAENPVLYGTWKALNIIEGLTGGGIHIPAFSVMGNMVDLSQFTIEGIAKTGIAGLGMLGSLLGALGSGGINPFSVDAWGFEQTTSRGTRRQGIASGISSGVSESNSMNMTTSSSGSDVKSTGMADKTDEAGEDSKTTNKDVASEGDIYEKIYAARADDKTSVLQEVIKLNDAIPSIAAEITKISTSSSAIQELLKLERIFKTAGEPSSTLLTKLDAITAGTDAIKVAITSMITATTPAGSHADGLNTVPYDGYIAELHEGEAVLTKEQAQLWRDGTLSDEQNKFVMQTAQTFKSLTVNPVNETVVQLANDSDITSKILTEVVNILGVTSNIKDILSLVDVQRALNTAIDANYKSVERTTSEVDSFVGSATKLVEVISKLKEEDKVLTAIQLVTGNFYNNLVQPIDNISKLYTVISSQLLTDKSIVVTPINEVYVTVPEIKVPDVNIPEIVLPEIKVPEIILPEIVVPKAEVSVDVPDVMVTVLPPEVIVNVDDISDIDTKVLNEIISLTGVAKSIRELIGVQTNNAETLVKRGVASESTVVSSIKQIDGVITGFSSVVDNQTSTVESISTLSAINAATMMSVGQTNKELQKELQEESRRRELTVSATKIGSITESQTTMGVTTQPTGKQPLSGVLESTGVTPEDFIKLLVDKLGGLEVRVTDMPGSDSTTPLYTIGGGTP